jgi:hypothetical protein
LVHCASQTLGSCRKSKVNLVRVEGLSQPKNFVFLSCTSLHSVQVEPPRFSIASFVSGVLPMRELT